MSFDDANLALKTVCPNNALIYDDKELPSAFVYVPKFRLCDVLSVADTHVHPAFIVNGTEIDGFWCGKFQTHHYGGRAYSMPRHDPATGTFDDFVAKNRAKGSGFHEITNAEWAAIALWCHKNGSEPNGNNGFGKDKNETVYKAIPSMERDSANRIQRVATGTGPIEWSHDRTLGGIWDMKGNVAEWVAGVRLVHSEVQVIPDNNAAHPDTDLTSASTAWKAINASATGWDDLYLTPDGNGTTQNSVKLDLTSSLKWKYIKDTPTSTPQYQDHSFYELTAEDTISDTAKKILMSLAMLPDLDLTGTGIDGTYGYNRIYILPSVADIRILRGASFYNSNNDLGYNPGIFDFDAAMFYSERGGRSAFIDL